MVATIDGCSSSVNDNANANASASANSGPVISPAIRRRIIEKVSSNRITIIVGPTGCGKSTQIPTILLEGLGGGLPILCTQPRRLAVVAIANHVAKQRRLTNPTTTSDDLEVGYHVGQKNHSSNSTKLLFVTAGILLEELRCNGADTVLSKYKCILIDECHERSAESDLCLAMIKTYLSVKGRQNKSTIKIILMSATFHHGRYRSFFQSIPGCEDIDTITLETVESINARQIETFYLEDIVRNFVDDDPLEHSALERTMRLDPMVDLLGGDRGDGGKSLSTDLVKLIRSLVIHLDYKEPVNASFLIFAPTYRHLEQCYEMLQIVDYSGEATHEFAISVLHSSVDMEDCLQSMQTMQQGQVRRRRHIFLASAIADSSLTIPGVTCVVDTCRALRVKWDANSRNHSAKTVWASKSTCDQRQGRTGRTCPGRVFRLLPRSYYISGLEQWEQPQLLLSSCQNEVLCLLSATAAASTGMNHLTSPVSLLEKCMDPPPKAVVAQAVQILKDIGACAEESHGNQRGGVKLVPTDYGRLLSALPFAMEDSRKIIAGAQRGYLHEALALWSIKSTRPYPIVHVFGDNDKNEDSMRVYYPQVDVKDPKSVALANLAAFMFWDTAWNHQRNRLMKERFSVASYAETDLSNDRSLPDCNVWKWDADTEKRHGEFCKKSNINPTSVRAIADTMDVTMKTLFHAIYEPEWLRCTNPEPIWRRPNDWEQDDTFYLEDTNSSMLHIVYGQGKARETIHILSSLWDGNASSDSNTSTQYSVLDIMHTAATATHENAKPLPACIHFLSGHCSFGDKCRYAHSYMAEPPPCRFFASGRCSKGNKCVYSHKQPAASIIPATTTRENPLQAIAPLKFETYDGAALDWYIKNASKLLLLGDGDFSFSQAMTMKGAPIFVSTTLEGSGLETKRRLKDVDATRVHRHKDCAFLMQNHDGNGAFQGCAWNFPYVTGVEMDAEAHERLLSGTFLSTALLFEQRHPRQQHFGRFGLALQGDQFSRWSVLRSANRAGWNLIQWSDFDPQDFPGYAPSRANGDPFPVDKARFYVFALTKHNVD
jgi:HrpA-like RNA helicase